ncbi:MAG: UvrD-helicase domain-containing protein [Ornithinimicrobium sp.]
MSDIETEQQYFDAASEARERARQTLGRAPEAAAGSRAAVSAVKRGVDEQLSKLGAADEPVAFARFSESDGESYYLGKHAISDDRRNKLVINWQAPAATPYFEATFDDPCGVVSRRKFSTMQNRVTDFDEVVFAELAAAVDQLTQADVQGVDDAVLRDLEQTRDGEMRDIVQTIHAAQYALIRSDIDQLLVIQGGPGTGKTAVALHRVSWLLWNFAGKVGPRDVLVVGPNATFTKYIRKVLPGLGDEDVQHIDIRSMGPISTTNRAEADDIQRLKGERRMADLLALALRQRVRVPAGVDSLEIGPPGRTVQVPRSAIEGMLKRLLEEGSSTINAGRQGFRAWLSRQTRDDVPTAQLEAAVERVWPNLSPQQFLQDLFSSRERLVAAAGDAFTAGDVQRLLRTGTTRVSEETWSDSDVALLDEAQFLMSGSPQSYGHVVLDEAQDLSPMQLRSIRRRSRRGSMTVVGDIAQSTGPWARDSWDDLVSALRQELASNIQELTLGYRVPQQIYALAAELLPVAAPGVTAPRVVRTAPEDPELVECEPGEEVAKSVVAAQAYAGRGLFVGVIVADENREELASALTAAGIRWGDAAQGQLSTSINVLSAEQSKGLEFDAIVVVEPCAIAAESDTGLRLLYIALTRSTRFLTITHSGALLPTRTGTTTDDAQEMFNAPAALVDSPATSAAAPEGRPTATRAPQGELFGVGPLPVDRSDDRSTVAGRSVERPRREVSKVARAVASSLAEEIRDSVTVKAYREVLEALRQELGVDGDHDL